MKRNLVAEQVILTLSPIVMFVVNIGVVAGMWMGAIKVDEGLLQVGVILAFINYLNIIMNGLMTSIHVLMQITKSFASASRISKVLETDSDINGANTTVSSSVQGSIAFEDVSFSYSKNGEYVLKNITFNIQAGQKVGIIGSTGSGKSTLVKLIPRLYDPDEGRVLIDGVDSREITLLNLRKAIGFVPQKASLFSGSIKENLQYGKEGAQEQEMEEAVSAAAAKEFINQLEEGFDYRLMQGATNLSGGQKQRLSMARAFIRQPKILVLDDSTSAIDAISEASVQQTLNEQKESMTVIIISSKISSIKDADQIFVMDDGRLVASGTHEELLNNSNVYRGIYETQTGKGVSSNE